MPSRPRWKGTALECTCTHGIPAHRKLNGKHAGCLLCGCRRFELGRYLLTQRNPQTTMATDREDDDVA